MQCKLDDWMPLGGPLVAPRAGAPGEPFVFFQALVTPAMMQREEYEMNLQHESEYMGDFGKGSGAPLP